MMLRLWNIRVLTRKDVLNDCRNISSLSIHKRWQSTEPAVNPDLAYMWNPGNAPLLETTVGRVLETAMENWPNRKAYISIPQNQSLTYSELLTRADRFAAGLKKLGLRQGDCIGIWSPNGIQWPIAYLAAARIGLITAGINPYYQLGEMDYSVNHVGLKAVIALDSYKNQNYADMLLQVKKTSPFLEHIIIYSDDHVQGTRRFSDIEALATKKDVEAVKNEQGEISPYAGTNLQFTSGTTGNPKATLLSHKSYTNNSRQGAMRFNLDGKKICINVPFFHAFGMLMGITGAIQTGASIVIENPTFNPAKSLETIAREKCNVTFGTPTMWLNMIDVQMRTGMKIDSLIVGATGGALASPNLFKKIREHMRLDNIKTIYGLTEATGIINQSLYEEPTELTDNTIGYISDHIEIKVIDAKGEIVPFGTPGELCVRGYSTMIEYWNDEKNTKKCLTEDKWLKTGDQYILHKNGYGQIVGRLKDMLIRGGENIFPKEIEHFYESHPAIAEVHVFGVHDETYGEEICACIRTQKNAKLTADDIRNYAKGKIAVFKIPRYIHFCDEFPKTTSGKIQKFKLKQELEERRIIPKKPEN